MLHALKLSDSVTGLKYLLHGLNLSDSVTGLWYLLHTLKLYVRLGNRSIVLATHSEVVCETR